MDSSAAQKVRYGTHMLAEEVDDWWLGTRQRLGAASEVITWVMFTREFLRNYFLEDVRGKKEMKFLELKQGNSTVAEYAAKFVELMKFYPYYSAYTTDFSNCRIYEEDNRTHLAYYKSHNEKKGRNQDRGKPYSTPVDKRKQKVSDGKKTSGVGAPAPANYYRYGEKGHRYNECENKDDGPTCYKCGKTGHHAHECKDDGPTCFNYGEQGHIST
ncbi:uncharacterized protein LOC131629117 [Vicia villosa]|uniref:uncharacterized protein LOC131629117 n=1 Tax=Vicia villosa TaxID=3911 RepID=UPI00273CCBDA|nr:uncharacterized protein LOC131629117 [Vicia villosa]